jgi:hypothetical protein
LTASCYRLTTSRSFTPMDSGTPHMSHASSPGVTPHPLGHTGHTPSWTLIHEPCTHPLGRTGHTPLWTSTHEPRTHPHYLKCMGHAPSLDALYSWANALDLWCTCTHARMHTCTHTRMHAHMHAHTHANDVSSSTRRHAHTFRHTQAEQMPLASGIWPRRLHHA